MLSISKWPVAAAQCRGVKPVCVLGFMLSISKWPVAAAQWRGVKPVCVLGFMLSISKWPCNVNLTHLGLFFLPN
jgi:hypothetical protein